MQTLKHISLFTINNFKQLQRKWYSLPLLLISPVIIIMMIAVLIVTFLNPDEKETIHVGLIDLDDSQETQMITKIMENSEEIGQFIEIEQMSKREATKQLKQNTIAAYITFPDAFTEKLYTGQAVNLEVTGNSNQPTESKLVHTLLQSVSRHINSSQANILTINHYAKQLDISDKERNEIIQNQFKNFLLFTIGKDKNISEEELNNEFSTSPIKYFSVATWFIMISIWLFIMYQFLFQDDTFRMKERMKLYGVTSFQQIISKIITSVVTTFIFAAGSFVALYQVIDIDLNATDFIKISVIILLYSITLLVFIGIIEEIIFSQKLRMVFQAIGLMFVLLCSGAIIPTIYFPVSLQPMLDELFSHAAFHYLKEILLLNQLYVDYGSLYIFCGFGMLLLLSISTLKGRYIK